MTLAAKVKESARGGDQDVATGTQGRDLGAFADAAIAGGDREFSVPRIGVNIFGDLDH